MHKSGVNNGDPAQPDTFTYTYDTYGAASLTEAPLYNTDGVQVRPPLTWVKNLQHDAAGRMTSIDTFAGTGPFSSGYEAGNLSYTTETRGFTVNGQMASQNWSTLSAWDGVTRAIGSLQYFTGLDASLSPTNGGAANGQIAAMVDGVSKETVLYQYDALKRLVAATSTPNAGSTVQSWAQSYQYDGFGNLTAKTLQTGAGAAVTTAIPVTVSTNRLTNASYDANGNMTSGSGVTLGYDEANRIASIMPTSGGAEYYGYAPDNKRMYRLNPATGVEELTLYGASGEKLAKFLVNGNTMSPAGAFVWFGGKMVGPGMAQQDRLGTNRGGGRFYPYGEQIGSATGTDGVQFATYRRDGVSGLDYADQRYYASTLGRFNTPDPYVASARGTNDATMPQSWNRYAYVTGDPVNLRDPRGLFGCGTICGDKGSSGGGGGGSSDDLEIDHSGDTSDGGGGDTLMGLGILVAVLGDPGASVHNGVIKNTLAALRKTLSNDSDCLGWLESGTAHGSVTQFDSIWNKTTVGSGVFLDSTGGNGTGIVAAITPLSSYDIVINANGAFFTRNSGVGFGVPAYIAPNTDIGRDFILLHELAHRFSAPGFIQNDGGKEADEVKNNQMILDKCKKTLGAGIA